MPVLEYGIRLYLAPNKRRFVSHNVIDLLFVLIPFLRPLRILRSARAFALLRATRGAVVLLRAVDDIVTDLHANELKLGVRWLIDCCDVPPPPPPPPPLMRRG